ncbi:MAG: sulfite exporter TauE/SafE family protein [Pseudomonadota bacterium]
MTLATFAILGGTIVTSSFISGVFGMAGGMVLLGVLLVYFDVATGMILFSIIQLAVNGWRALHWRRFVRWPIFWWYVVGGLAAFALMRWVAYVPDKAVVYILLGLMPFMVEVLPRRIQPSIEWKHIPLITGFFTTIVQFMAGVGGLFFDLFFQKSSLDRKTTNATKAITQTFSHILRVGYFGSLVGFGDLHVEVWGPSILLALVGAIAAPFVLERMTDDGFRRWTKVIVFTLAMVYLVRGGLLFWQRM